MDGTIASPLDLKDLCGCPLNPNDLLCFRQTSFTSNRKWHKSFGFEGLPSDLKTAPDLLTTTNPHRALPVYSSTHRNWSAHRLEDILIKHGRGFHITSSAFTEHGSARLDQSKLFKLHKAQAIMSHNLFLLMLYETSA